MEHYPGSDRLGPGGIFGLGLGASQQKFYYLPNAQTDAIFAVIGEELGIIGTIGLILLFGFVAYRGIRIAVRRGISTAV